MEEFVNFCEDTIFEMQLASSISVEQSAEGEKGKRSKLMKMNQGSSSEFRSSPGNLTCFFLYLTLRRPLRRKLRMRWFEGTVTRTSLKKTVTRTTQLAPIILK